MPFPLNPSLLARERQRHGEGVGERYQRLHRLDRCGQGEEPRSQDLSEEHGDNNEPQNLGKSCLKAHAKDGGASHDESEATLPLARSCRNTASTLHSLALRWEA